MRNEGKRFEEDFVKSVTDDMFCLRLKDAGGWSNATNTRFTVKNICDFILFKSPYLALVELKSVKGKSIPLDNITQLDILYKATGDMLEKWIVVNFREYEKTYAIKVDVMMMFKSSSTKKSINIVDAEIMGIEIPCKKKISRYTYDLNKLLEE